jgi:hypothetical protein
LPQRSANCHWEKCQTFESVESLTRLSSGRCSLASSLAQAGRLSCLSRCMLWGVVITFPESTTAPLSSKNPGAGRLNVLRDLRRESEPPRYGIVILKVHSPRRISSGFLQAGSQVPGFSRFRADFTCPRGLLHRPQDFHSSTFFAASYMRAGNRRRRKGVRCRWAVSVVNPCGVSEFAEKGLCTFAKRICEVRADCMRSGEQGLRRLGHCRIARYTIRSLLPSPGCTAGRLDSRRAGPFFPKRQACFISSATR